MLLSYMAFRRRPYKLSLTFNVAGGIERVGRPQDRRSPKGERAGAILPVDRTVDEPLFDQESTKLARYDFVSQRREVAVEEFI